MTKDCPQTKSYVTEQNFEESITVNNAITAAEKKEIYNFRYQIYVEEMFKQIDIADKKNKILSDNLDEWGILLSAKIGSKLIATARINIGTIDDFPLEEAAFLSLSEFQDCPGYSDKQQYALITKIMVAPAYRSSRAFYQLLAKCYELCCSNNVNFMFGLCNLHLIRLYEKLGIHRYGKNFFLPGYGLQTPLVLLINDLQHLRIIRSPLFRIARKREGVDTRSVEWFHNKFTHHSNFINSQTVTEEKLWNILSERLAGTPTEIIGLLSRLSVTEAKKFIHNCGSYVQCDPGNLITIQGDVSYTYNILIAGRVKSLTLLHPVKEYSSPGHHIGTNGLTEHNFHTEDIAAVDSTDLLILSGIAFQRFSHSYPEIAHKVIQYTQAAKNIIINVV
ncbi:N-acyl amino acid synthase FeeM domain-containing protein [Sporomusa termitida]|uniref:Cyclic nucleotide-binding domain-containing protein n=1 Tax=Sporomusa termitida TaxID=2377 RepID=A0A517DQ37_9FIRM|nr:cyclic nucleotide-binding domain-containing protein [Sporomusa termitida]QDR79484.1 hypothetical protein SPTER_07590 [Sporomusa termitida]